MANPYCPFIVLDVAGSQGIDSAQLVISVAINILFLRYFFKKVFSKYKISNRAIFPNSHHPPLPNPRTGSQPPLHQQPTGVAERNRLASMPSACRRCTSLQKEMVALRRENALLRTKAGGVKHGAGERRRNRSSPSSSGHFDFPLLLAPIPPGARSRSDSITKSPAARVESTTAAASTTIADSTTPTANAGNGGPFFFLPASAAVAAASAEKDPVPRANTASSPLASVPPTTFTSTTSTTASPPSQSSPTSANYGELLHELQNWSPHNSAPSKDMGKILLEIAQATSAALGPLTEAVAKFTSQRSEVMESLANNSMSMQPLYRSKLELR